MSTTGKTDWGQFQKRMEGIAQRECANRGFAIMSIDILVGADGTPIFWAEPKLTKIEPRIGATLFLERVIEILGQQARGRD